MAALPLIPAFDVHQAMAACGVNDVDLFDGATASARMALDMFNDSFHSCMDKTFDKVDREGLMNSLYRLRVDEKLINLVKMIYRKTEFVVEIDGKSSEWTIRSTGIRQGCPLSPYLFLTVMT